MALTGGAHFVHLCTRTRLALPGILRAPASHLRLAALNSIHMAFEAGHTVPGVTFVSWFRSFALRAWRGCLLASISGQHSIIKSEDLPQVPSGAVPLARVAPYTPSGNTPMFK
jgi:hypothetical protein